MCQINILQTYIGFFFRFRDYGLLTISRKKVLDKFFFFSGLY